LLPNEEKEGKFNFGSSNGFHFQKKERKKERKKEEL
jgi:hypothetical protein